MFTIQNLRCCSRIRSVSVGMKHLKRLCVFLDPNWKSILIKQRKDWNLWPWNCEVKRFLHRKYNPRKKKSLTKLKSGYLSRDPIMYYIRVTERNICNPIYCNIPCVICRCSRFWLAAGVGIDHRGRWARLSETEWRWLPETCITMW